MSAAVAGFRRVQRFERLGEVAAGIEGKDVEGEVGGGDAGEDGLILDAEGRGKGHAAGDVFGDNAQTCVEARCGGKRSIEGGRQCGASGRRRLARGPDGLRVQ